MGKYTFLFLPAFLLCILCSCNENEKKSQLIHSVEITYPIASSKTITRNYSGVVREAHEVSLGFKTPGQIERIHVKEGDYVRKGELLAKLDDKDYRLGVEALQVQYDQVKAEVARMRTLFEQKSISPNDFEKATAGLKQLEIQLQLNKNKLEYTSLYAPTNGYIQSINFSSAEMVDAGTPVFTFLDVSHLEVVADLPSEIFQEMKNVTDYRCKVLAAGEENTYPMDFISISPKADGNQLYQLRLKFREYSDRQLTPGMNIEVSIVLNQDSVGKTGYSIPMSSVFRQNDEACVWVLKEDSTVERRTVTMDTNFSGKNALVTKGVSSSDKIVCTGVNSLRDGEKVIVIKKPEKSNVGGLI